MIKIFCDVCGEEPQDPGFGFETSIFEVILDFSTGREVPRKRSLQVCKKCYEENLKEAYDNLTNKLNERDKNETTV